MAQELENNSDSAIEAAIDVLMEDMREVELCGIRVNHIWVLYTAGMAMGSHPDATEEYLAMLDVVLQPLASFLKAMHPETAILFDEAWEVGKAECDD